MFNPAAYENSRPGGIGVLEITAGDEGQQQRPRMFVPLQRSELRGEASGPLAALQMIQTYRYSSEDSAETLEAVYRFPLPGDAAVTGVRVRFGEVEIRADLQERQQAERSYQEAKRQGRQSALLSRESPDVFTLQIAGLQPDKEILIETSYVQLARPEGTGWSLRMPLTTPPRYVRGDEHGSRHAAGQPLLVMRDPGHRFALDLTVHAASAHSPTHRLALERQGERLRLRLEQGEVIPDRDCVITWQPAQEQDRPLLDVMYQADAEAGYVYFLALVAPPAVHDSASRTPREVVLLVDHSGSMAGAKWEAADWAVKQFLSGLDAGDAFNLGLFHNSTRWFADKPQPGDEHALRQAGEFLERYRDHGGTELGVALEQALSQEPASGEYARHVLIVTDAQVTDAQRILRLADQQRHARQRRRVSLLCIDAAPNSFLVHELAQRGGGLARFLTSDPDHEDITTALDEVLTEWEAPVLANLRLEIDRPEVQASGREQLALEREGWSAIDVGELPAGRSVWIAGRAPFGESADLNLRLTAGGREIAGQRLLLSKDAGERPALKVLFGARHLLGLEYLLHAGYSGDALHEQLRRLGYDPSRLLAEQSDAAPKVYAENTRQDLQAALRDLLVREALSYGLASAETAFVAVRSEAGRPVEGLVPVANALPSGWSDDFASPMLASGFGPALAPPPAAMPPSAPAADSAPRAQSGVFASLASFADRFVQGTAPSASQPTAGPPAEPADSAKAPLFSGAPAFSAGEAELYNSEQSEASALPAQTTITRLRLRLKQSAPEAGIDAGILLLIYVGDPTQPRARVRLADLLRMGGERPLNILREAGQPARIVLQDPAGSWLQQAPEIELWLEWK